MIQLVIFYLLTPDTVLYIFITMNMYKMTDNNILIELGRRLKQARINRNQTHKELSAKSGISIKTIQNIENGKSASLKNIISILRALNLLDQLDNFLPVQKISPIALAEMKGKKRQRASSKYDKKDDEDAEW